MANEPNKLHFLFDQNVEFYEIEVNDGFNPSTLSEEEAKAIDDNNLKFIDEVLEPQMLATFSVCPCQMNDFMQRNETRRQLMNIPPQAFRPTIEQVDIDKFRYSVIVIAENGKFTGASAILRECKNCHKIDYWGDVGVFTRMLAEITTNFYSTNTTSEVEVSAENPLGGDVYLSDVEAGPVPASDIMMTDVNENLCGHNCAGCAGCDDTGEPSEE